MADIINFQDYLKKNLPDSTKYMIAFVDQKHSSDTAGDSCEPSIEEEDFMSDLIDEWTGPQFEGTSVFGLDHLAERMVLKAMLIRRKDTESVQKIRNLADTAMIISERYSPQMSPWDVEINIREIHKSWVDFLYENCDHGYIKVSCSKCWNFTSSI